MEKAILKTLIYADIFDYPLNIYEIHKWLIMCKANLRQIEDALARLYKKKKVFSYKGYWFLSNKKSIVLKRVKNEKQSKNFYWKAKHITWFLRLIPWVKLVGVSGGLAMQNAQKEDDIDLFIILSKNRLWISRLLIIGFLDAMGVRRRVNMKANQISGKLCTNLLVEEDKLEQDNKDLFVAHEILQMKVLWQKEGIYYKFLSDNEWAFNFLPNWITSNGKWKMENGKLKTKQNSQFSILNSQFDWLEELAKWFQLKIMQKPKGMERILDGALYFHPNDIRVKILQEYKTRVRSI